MKNLLLSKSLLSKSLSKSLSKVFLLVALFFGGCSTTTETNTTPTDALIDLIGGKWGYYEVEYYEGEPTTCWFFISNDATYYREIIDGVVGLSLPYTTGTDNSATYEGSIDFFGIELPVKVTLTGLTSNGGTYTLYFLGTEFNTEFTWGTYSLSSVSSSKSAISSAIQALSQQQ